jgi:hypothetical protein
MDERSLKERLADGAVLKMITIRLPPELKDAVHTAAYESHMSLNSYCIMALAKSLPATNKETQRVQPISEGTHF